MGRPEISTTESVSVMVTDHERRDKNKKYTVYKIVFERDSRLITALRRYNEILMFYDKMRKRYPDAQFKLPGKKIFGSFNPEVIKDRREAVKIFIVKLLARTDCILVSEVRTFLNLDSTSHSSSDETEDEGFFSEYSTRSGSRSSLVFHSTRSVSRNSLNDDPIGLSERNQTKPNDFEFLSVVGKGSFGRVFLARPVGDNQKTYAIKVLNKSHVMKKNEVRHVMCERRVLAKTTCHPFLVGLHCSFQTHDKLYLVMDYANGGELFFHLSREKRFTESRAKFYAAEIASALGFLHAHNIIYRDLKPENILLDSEGHIALTDFGLCKEDAAFATTFCGTPEYLAPEVLQHRAYDRMVDWWCLGAVLYELIFGLPPFYSKDRATMFDWTQNKELEFKSSVTITPAAKDLLTKMLAKNKEERLGSVNDFKDIKSHDFFLSINWTLLDQRKIDPPFRPNLTNTLTDVSNFDPNFTSLQITDSVTRSTNTYGLTTSLQTSDRSAFEGFSYAPPADEGILAF